MPILFPCKITSVANIIFFLLLCRCKLSATSPSSSSPHSFRPPRTASGFEPYETNGGLVCGVAGTGYVVMACDTRMGREYGILSRGAGSDGGAPNRLWPIGADEFGAGDLPPAVIASGGCAADCDGLRRRMQRTAHDHAAWSYGTTMPPEGAGGPRPARPRMGARDVAVLLQSALYSRRVMPFYAFCVLGGIDGEADVGGGAPPGAVYVYDAIGSFERVAVGTNGQGKEMLQPILDGLFSAVASPEDTGGRVPEVLRRDPSAVAARDQRDQSGSLRSPVRTVVDCDVEKAVQNLVRAYRSVCEREIGVGDELVIWILRSDELRDFTEKAGEQAVPNEEIESTGPNRILKLPALEIRRFPLKGH